MAYYKKFTDNKRPGQGAAPPRRERSYSRGGYQQDDGNRKRQDAVATNKPRGEGQRRFGPGSEPAGRQWPGRSGTGQRQQGGFGRPGYGRNDRGQQPAGRGYQSRTQSPAERPAGSKAPSRPFGRPAQQAERVYGRPAPVQDQVLPAAASTDSLPENILSGRNPIREALKTGRDIEKLMVASGELSGSAREIVAMARAAGVKVQVVERSRLDQIMHHHQGMIAYASAYAYSSLEDILALAKERGEAPFVIILDKVTDPQNLGAIIRTAACVGAHGVLVQLHRAVGLTPSAVRASAGAVEHVKVARVVNINNSIRSLKQQGIWVYAGDAAGKDYRQVNISGPCALVIGSEGEGISPLTLSLCDEKLSIPMTGAIDSLNASVAAGILMYAAYTGRTA